jgi:hypothetical protein
VVSLLLGLFMDSSREFVSFPLDGEWKGIWADFDPDIAMLVPMIAMLADGVAEIG